MEINLHHSNNCDNYRPLSLVCVTYKLFAAVVLKRLQRAGAEDGGRHMADGWRRQADAEEER